MTDKARDIAGSLLLFLAIVLAMGVAGCPGSGDGPSPIWDEDHIPPEYLPGEAIPLETAPETQSASSPDGSAATVQLSDGTTASLPGQGGPFEISLSRITPDDHLVALLDNLKTSTALISSGAVRSIALDATTRSPADLKPVITIPADQAGTINPETINVLRVATTVAHGEAVEDHISLLPVSLDGAGGFQFVDHLMPYSLSLLEEHSDGEPVSQRPKEQEDDADGGRPVTSRVSYLLMSFQGELNWYQQPRLIQMTPDLSAEGYRRPATSQEREEQARRPLCNLILLVHGHNEEEKDGSMGPTAESPWEFGYKRRVWDLLYKETLAGQGGVGGFPGECTMFYEFIYPTYRPIFSPVPDRSGRSGREHQTLGEALGLRLQHEFIVNTQLRSMVRTGMRLNAFIIAHSQGGLVARSGLRHMPKELKDNIERVITWGSPHHGAALYTLRYAFQAGHDMILIDEDSMFGGRVPLQDINNSWLVGSRFVELLNSRVAIDAPGIRDLRWEASERDKTALRTLFPTLTPEAEEDLIIPIFSENLTVFNQSGEQELSGGGYSFFYGLTSKSATLQPRSLLYAVEQVWNFAVSSSIEQGASLNEMTMQPAYRPNDGAVPQYSQQASGVTFSPAAVVQQIFMGDTDHEEFYGAEPPQRYQGSGLLLGQTTARRTLQDGGLREPPRSCPTIEATVSRLAEGTEATGSLTFPLYTEGGGELGGAIKGIEARLGEPDGPPIRSFSFTHQPDGTFRGVSRVSIPDGDIIVVAIFKDDSEVSVEASQVRVSIQPPRTVIYELGMEISEVTHEFEASASPPGIYRFEWNFDDGSGPQSQTPMAGELARISHTYRNLRDGQRLSPSVRLLDLQGSLLAEDTITITFTVLEDEEPLGDAGDIPDIGDPDEQPGEGFVMECGWPVELSSLVMVEEFATTLHYENQAGQKHGPYYKWHDSGRTVLRTAACYFEDQLHGPYYEWTTQGNPLTEANYQHGLRHGLYREWRRREGILYREANYYQGELHGVAILWCTNGAKAEEFEYEHGVLHGRYLVWYCSGNPKAEGNFTSGSMTGIWTHWNDDGSCQYVYDYGDGTGGVDWVGCP